MLNTEKPLNSRIYPRGGKYFKFQMSGWTDFDPMDKNLSELTEAIENGGGFVTAVEVLEIADDLSRIKDKEVLEGFQNILAAKRVLENVGELPKKLVDELRSALKAQEGGEEKKPLTPPAVSVLRQA